MYRLKPSVKTNPVLRWALPDRIFFGHGGCPILAGAFLDEPPVAGFHAEKITPAEGFSGNHIFVTNGKVAFDYHGYCCRDRLLDHHARGWSARYPGQMWSYVIEQVDYDLLDTHQLNQRKMLGPDQYLHDPIARAKKFIAGKDHTRAVQSAAIPPA